MNKFLFPCAALCAALALCALPCAKASAATVSGAECVLEQSSRRILHAENADARLPMASTTKILTAAIVLDDCDLDGTVEIPAQAAGVEGSSVYLKAGDVYTVRDLLYGLMLRSGNDCAVALALYHSGSVEAFAQTMNERAARMGASQSKFANPHGLPDAEHYTTARDLALIASYALENETFRDIVSCKYYEPRGYKNKNKMLYNYEGATGVKTGFTAAAGRCLVTSAERDGMRLVSVVLNSPQMYERTAELLDDAYSRYAMICLCDPAVPIENFSVRHAFSYPLTQAEAAEVRTETELFAPQAQGEEKIAGRMKIYLRNDLLFSQILYIM